MDVTHTNTLSVGPGRAQGIAQDDRSHAARPGRPSPRANSQIFTEQPKSNPDADRCSLIAQSDPSAQATAIARETSHARRVGIGWSRAQQLVDVLEPRNGPRVLVASAIPPIPHEKLHAIVDIDRATTAALAGAPREVRSAARELLHRLWHASARRRRIVKEDDVPRTVLEMIDAGPVAIGTHTSEVEVSAEAAGAYLAEEPSNWLAPGAADWLGAATAELVWHPECIARARKLLVGFATGEATT